MDPKLQLDPRDHVAEWLDDLHHDLVTAEQAEVIEAHCLECQACRSALELARHRAEMLQSGAVAADQALVDRTIARIDEHVRRRQQVWDALKIAVPVATAAAVLILGSLHLLFLFQRPTSYDLRVLGQSRLAPGSPAVLRVALLDRSSGQPVRDASVTLTLRDRSNGQQISLASFQTSDAPTQAVPVQIPDWNEGNYLLGIDASVDSRSDESLRQIVTLKRSTKLIVSTDKPVYQAGQTIRIRLLSLLQHNLKPFADQPWSCTVTDAGGNVIFKRQGKTSRFGIASANCALADEDIPEGLYHVDARVGDVQSRRTVKVQPYVLPKFDIALSTDRSFYEPGQPAELQLNCRYFFGKPVADAQVKIEVWIQAASLERINSTTLQTDAEGKATHLFAVPKTIAGLPQLGGAGELILYATVTDGAGQSQVVSVPRLITLAPIQISVSAEGGQLVQGVENAVFIQTRYADGQPAKCQVTVEIANGETISVQTNELGAGQFRTTPDDALRIKVIARDDQDNSVEQLKTLVVGDQQGDFLVRTNQVSYSPGDTIAVTLLGSGREPVFVDLIKNRQTVVSHVVEMEQGKGQLAIDVGTDLFGPVQLVAYRFLPDGLTRRKNQLLWIEKTSDLKIEAVFDAGQYRPGETAKVQLKLTDAGGQPAPGAIGLAAVDEAVFAVHGERAGLGGTIERLEQQWMEPTATLYQWPEGDSVEVPSPQRELFQRALFSRIASTATGQAAMPIHLVASLSERPNDATPADATPADATPADATPADATPADTASPAPYTLASTSYPKKSAIFAKQRSERLMWVKACWAVLALILILITGLTLGYFWPRVFAIGSTIGVALALLLSPLTALVMMSENLQVAATGGAEVADMAVANAAPGAAYPGSAAGGESAPEPPRVRELFPETLAWHPQLVTDDNGVATLELPLADSITTWRVSADAITSAGQIGAEQFSLKVFQPFFVDLNLPVAMTRNDQVTVPVVVHNYLEQRQQVTVELQPEAWYQPQDAGDGEAGDSSQAFYKRTLELAPGEVKSIGFPIQVLRVGSQTLTVTGRSTDVADAVKRKIEVLADGRRLEQVLSGRLDDPLQVEVDFPETSIPGSERAVVTLYPSAFTQLVEGLDAIFQMPHGCFEQTSSTTYPNVLALDYLRRAKLDSPEIEAKARQYIHLGYQRLISFEVDGGGFDWYGRPPAHVGLTAYGLLEFKDLARVYDVDPELISRTSNWLLQQRGSDGTWQQSDRVLNQTSGSGDDPRLALTAYVAWAVFQGTPLQYRRDDARSLTALYLSRRKPTEIDNPYTLALIINALVAIDPGHVAIPPFVQHLDSLKQVDAQRDLVWWQQPQGRRTQFYGAGPGGDVETTAMAALALMNAKKFPSSSRGALHWLVANKDVRGTWFSTQATVLALKALLHPAANALNNAQPRLIEITVDGKVVRRVQIPAEQLDVVQRIDLTDQLIGGRHQVTVRDVSQTATSYHVLLRHHLDEPPEAPSRDDLEITVRYGNDQLQVDQEVTADVSVVNHTRQLAPMVMLDLPIPPGFILQVEDLEVAKRRKQIGHFQITPQQAVIYLRNLRPHQSWKLRYRLRATMPVDIAVPAAKVYEYYNPNRRSQSEPSRLQVEA